MKSQFLPLLAILLAIACCNDGFSQDEQLTEEDLARIQLPMDRDAPVFVYDVTGGFRMVNPDQFKSTPMLTIYADGKVVTGSSIPGVEHCQQKWTESELNQFLHWVVNRQKLYEITTAGIKQEMAESGQNLRITDAGTSEFKVNLQRGSHTVQIYALFAMAPRYENIESLQRMLEIENRCKQLIAQTNLGTGKDVEEMLVAINKKLKTLQPDFAPIDIADVRYATRYVGGKLQANFEKSYPASDDSQAQTASVRFVQNGKESTPDISIRFREDVN